MELDRRSTRGQPAAPGPDEGTKNKRGGTTIRNTKRTQQGEKPGWAMGLRQLYDSVVDEPLPPSFSDLLSKLDSKS